MHRSGINRTAAPCSYICLVSSRGVGCILYEMATGRPMFPGATVKEELHLIFRLMGKNYNLPPSNAGINTCCCFLTRCVMMQLLSGPPLTCNPSIFSSQIGKKKTKHTNVVMQAEQLCAQQLLRHRLEPRQHRTNRQLQAPAAQPSSLMAN